MTESPIKLKDIAAQAEGIKCPVGRLSYIVEGFLAGPMCGRCLPCPLGSYEAKIRLRAMMEGRGSEADLSAIRTIADTMAVMSMCKKGKDTAEYMHEALKSDEFRAHATGPCPAQTCKSVYEYSIEAEKCTMCGKCLPACKVNAILGESARPLRRGFKPFEIRQKRCTKCGDCVPACPEGAISMVAVSSEELVKA